MINFSFVDDESIIEVIVNVEKRGLFSIRLG